MIPGINVVISRTIDDTIRILGSDPARSRVIAGGTDIIPGLQQGARRFRNIKQLVDINHIPELRSILFSGKGASLGAAVTFSDIISNPLLERHYPVLVKAARTIGSVQIRNRATLAGNFINNAPCADSVPALLVYEATLRIQSSEVIREVPLADFLTRPYQTRLQPGELVTEILLPSIRLDYQGDFYKLGRRRGVAISRITLAILLKRSGKTIKDIRIASGAVTPIGKRFIRLETETRKKKITPALVQHLAVELGKEILNETGLRWSTPYKLPVVQQVCHQLLLKLIYDTKRKNEVR